MNVDKIPLRPCSLSPRGDCKHQIIDGKAQDKLCVMCAFDRSQYIDEKSNIHELCYPGGSRPGRHYEYR